MCVRVWKQQNCSCATSSMDRLVIAYLASSWACTTDWGSSYVVMKCFPIPNSKETKQWRLSYFMLFKTSISVHFPISTNHPLGWSNRVLDIWSKSTWPADGQVIKRTSNYVVKQQGAMFAYELKPRLRIGISQNVFYIPPDAMHKVHIRQWKKKNVQHLRRRQQLRSCHTFASQLLGESDRPSQPCHVHHQVEGHVAKAYKSTQKQPSLRTNLQGLAAKIPVVSVNTVPMGWVR